MENTGINLPMKITLLGTGTSMGIPMIGCRCKVCRSADPCDKRLRTSAWVEIAGKHLIIDTGIDFRNQALRAGIPSVDAVIFTHHHVDHIFGLDDLRPINFLQKKVVDIYSDTKTREHLESVYPYIFSGEKYESDTPKIRMNIIDKTPFEIFGQKIIPVPLWHGKLQIFGFRIGDFAYCTDVNRIPEESFDLLKDLRYLVLGALRYREHPTHFTIEQAVKAAKQVGAEQTYLVHLSHEVSHRQLNQNLPSGIQAACDGTIIRLH